MEYHKMYEHSIQEHLLPLIFLVVCRVCQHTPHGCLQFLHIHLLGSASVTNADFSHLIGMRSTIRKLYGT